MLIQQKVFIFLPKIVDFKGKRLCKIIVNVLGIFKGKKKLHFF